MSKEWQNLRMGDRIRFVRMPTIFSRPGYQIAQETLELYELLISTGDPIELDGFMDDGAPIAGYVDRRDPDSPVFHGLIIDNDDEGCWEFVSRSTD